jgi:hypothetical protein
MASTDPGDHSDVFTSVLARASARAQQVAMAVGGDPNFEVGAPPSLVNRLRAEVLSGNGSKHACSMMNKGFAGLPLPASLTFGSIL